MLKEFQSKKIVQLDSVLPLKTKKYSTRIKYSVGIKIEKIFRWKLELSGGKKKNKAKLDLKTVTGPEKYLDERAACGGAFATRATPNIRADFPCQ